MHELPCSSKLLRFFMRCVFAMRARHRVLLRIAQKSNVEGETDTYRGFPHSYFVLRCSHALRFCPARFSHALACALLVTKLREERGWIIMSIPAPGERLTLAYRGLFDRFPLRCVSFSHDSRGALACALLRNTKKSRRRTIKQ